MFDSLLAECRHARRMQEETMAVRVAPAGSMRRTVPPGRFTVFAALTGLTSLVIFGQAVIAGQLVSQPGQHGWVSVHDVVADVACGLSLVTAIYAAAALRRAGPGLVVAAAGLFVLVLAQTGIGNLITHRGDDGLIAVHVPLAFVIFGLTLWLSVRAALSRRTIR
jgi:hypothetical protein